METTLLKDRFLSVSIVGCRQRLQSSLMALGVLLGLLLLQDDHGGHGVPVN